MDNRAERTLNLEYGMCAGFISDLHLGPARPDIEQRLGQFLSEARGRLDALFILGDLFEFWIGDDAAAACGHESVVQLLADFFHQTDCRGFVMHGNRDFLIGDDFCRNVGCELLPDPCILLHGGSRILLSHGDAWCTDDVDHQRFRAMVHDPKWQQEFLARSDAERLHYAVDARARSESGKAIKAADIMDVNSQAIDDAMRWHDVRYVIHGHTHRPAVHLHHPDHEPAYRIVLGDWFEQQNTLTIESGTIHYTLAGQTHELKLGPR
jgi:UDP-2,3-diacylglucosamine hydrolase